MKKLNVICFYLVLLVISLPIPLLQRATDKVIEGMRPVMKMDDGTYEGMLMPGELFGLRQVGHLSWIVLGAVIAFFILSFFLKRFSRLEFICALAVSQSAFAVVYAVTAIMVFLVRNP